MCVAVEYLTFDILLHAKSEKKVIGNQICTPIIFKNPLKNSFFFIKKSPSMSRMISRPLTAKFFQPIKI